MASDDHGTELNDLSHRDDRRLLCAVSPSETFSGPNQLHALLFWQSLRWLGTVVFVVFLFAMIKIFQNKGNLDPVQKNLFNSLNIALSLALGYNFNVSQWLEEMELSYDLRLCRSASRNPQGFCDGSCEHGLRKVGKETRLWRLKVYRLSSTLVWKFWLGVPRRFPENC